MSIPIDILDKQGLDEEESRFVSLREALESEEYKIADGSLLLPVGRDESG